MSQINTWRRARKPYRCENAYPPEDAFLYGHPDIKPGDAYARLALTPNDNDIGNTGWMTTRYCRPCAENRVGMGPVGGAS